MLITVKCFANLRETVGIDTQSLAVNGAPTIADIWCDLTASSDYPADVFCALNGTYATSATPVADGDEVAFFPSVTGG